ncbi:hypothetical protein P691DRAFT_844497 [Macrolepiota fuliginosa MF-IS2]|uniref:WDR59/RTC1-like RING zinc finger domain-containing protein n=1 Tax=Macrolepiota fuliginosa MF-IS2 TaxID=1400762 RepID=A0A9P5X4E7_9AGAR|nr:hypothetical protein P691DRAFT_844497 [Macrolepiota fuliginosa MF-IS2]
MQSAHLNGPDMVDVIRLGQLKIGTLMSFHNPFDVYSDSRTHPDPGPSRSTRLPKVTLPGGGIISKGEDGRVAVAGRESLRILRVTDTTRTPFKIESSRNLWEGSGLKIDCASTDVAWAYGDFNNKILTSARNGELIMWDLFKSGHSKYERKTKEHLRSIHAMSVSRVVHHYCMTGSADGDFRVWDLRDIQSSVMRVHNPSAVRRVIFSPCIWNPLFVLVGMDNGTLHRWDLKMGQRGLLDRLPVAHTAPITTMDWYSGGEESSHAISISGPQGPDDYTGNTLGWVASAGLDRCVKVWNLTGPEAAVHMPNKPTYTLHTSYPVRRVLWRPGYECELAVVSHADFTISSQVDHLAGTPLSSGTQSRVGSTLGLDSMLKNFPAELKLSPKEFKLTADQSGPILDAVEVWDVRRSWIPKWSVTGTSVEGGVTDIEFADPHLLLAQNTNGTFTQVDMRDTSKPLDAVPRTSTAWTPNGTLAFVTDNVPRWEIPYDDMLNQELAVTKASIKRIGDPSFRPKTQKLGVCTSALAQFEADAFRKLASAYVIDGDDLPALCAKNMQAALAVGKPHIAQIWMLMNTSLTQHIPSLPPTPPQSPPPPRISSLTNLPRHTASTPTSALASYPFPSSTSASRSPDVSRKRASPRHFPIKIGRSPSTSQRATPNSSNSSSPLHLPLTLPPITPRRPSFLGRKESVDSSGKATKFLLRRQSVSGALHHHHHHHQHGHSASPIDKNSSTSVKNAGEGVLSDSDSSPGSDDEDEDDGADEQTVGVESSSEEIREEEEEEEQNRITPSPLSRLAEQRHWTEDDDPGSSPSPGSTDTESEEGDSTSVRRTPGKQGQGQSGSSRRRRVNRPAATRSRSSTLASLPAAPIYVPPPTMQIQVPRLNTRESKSSIKTVTAAAETSFQTPEPSNGFRDEAGRESGSRHRGKVRERERLHEEEEGVGRVGTARRADIVGVEEEKMLKYCWEALREAFEGLVIDGDVQTAAVMAAVAAEGLGVSVRRRLHIFDAYIDQLLKYQLYTTAAYFRKHSKVQQIKNMTLLDTTIYTICGKCKKPLIRPVGRPSEDSWKRPTFSYCLGCKGPTVTCTICRLPVRNMLFQCSICHHGGHQSCYRQFYLSQPMLDLPRSAVLNESRGRPPTRSLTTPHEFVRSSTQSTAVGSDYAGNTSPTRTGAAFMSELAGHPCAAGCGHFCWAALKQL